MRTIIKRFLSATAIAAAGLMVWTGFAPQALAAKPIRIGVMAPRAHIDGKSIFRAAKLAAENINAGGGIDGRKIKLYTYDTKFSASNTSRAFQRAVKQDHVSAVVGLFTSEVSLAMMPWAARLKTPLIITGAASSQIPIRVGKNYKRYKYIFHGYYNSAVIAKAACITSKDLFTDNPKLSYLNRAVIFSEDADWTQPVDKEYKKCLPKAGFKIVDTIVFSPKTKDFTPLYSRMEKDKANMIMAAIAHVGVKPVVQWHQQQVPAIFSGINGQGGASVFWKATNGATEGVVVGNVGANGAPLTSRTAPFYKAFTKQFGVTEPAYDAYTTYDAMYALKHAIEKAGSTKADAIVKGLEKVSFTGVAGQVRYYGKDGKWPHEVVFNTDPKKGMSLVVFQWQDGKQVVIWPKKLAKGKIEIPSFVPQPSK
jgi:branched-chain amino acid transport system substrate-binding protein